MKQRSQSTVHISVADQRLMLKFGDGTTRSFPVSTSRFGLGFKEGSMKTPTGKFRVAAKIGDGARIGTVFKNRKPMKPAAERFAKDEDLILSRILWLEGVGKRNANTHARYIYIHGTNHERDIGHPASHGCVRMKNRDVCELFDLVDGGTEVTISRTTTRRGRGE